MVALRYAYLVALVFWVGGLLALGGIAGPALFEALTASEGGAGRELAGRAFGAVLARFHIAAYVAAAAMILALLLMRVLGPRPLRFGVRLAIVSAMAAVTLYSGLFLTGRIQRLQREIGGPVAALPEHDPRRATFGRLHGLSTLLMMVTAAGGLALLYWEARTHD
jgi:hypothetical protein